MNVKIVLNVIKGKATKKQQGLSFGIILLSLLTIFLIAQLFYPGGYSFLNNHISNQGGIANNPRGFMVFVVGVTIVGPLMIPHFIYIYRRIMPTTKLLTQFALFCGIVGSIGFMFVGLIPEDFGEPHEIAADLAFGGFAVFGFLMLFIFIRKLMLQDPWPKLMHVVVIYSICITLVVFTVLFGSVFSSEDFSNVDPRWFTWPPWQWISFLNVIFLLAGIFLIIPDSKEIN